MEQLLIDDNKLLSDYGPDDNLLPVIVSVFSLHDIVLETTHVNNNLQTIDQCSSPLDPIPAVQTVVNDTSAKPTQENLSMFYVADKKFACTYCWWKFDKNLRWKDIFGHIREKSHSLAIIATIPVQQKKILYTAQKLHK